MRIRYLCQITKHRETGAWVAEDGSVTRLHESKFRRQGANGAPAQDKDIVPFPQIVQPYRLAECAQNQCAVQIQFVSVWTSEAKLLPELTVKPGSTFREVSEPPLSTEQRRRISEAIRWDKDVNIAEAPPTRFWIVEMRSRRALQEAILNAGSGEELKDTQQQRLELEGDLHGRSVRQLRVDRLAGSGWKAPGRYCRTE